MSIPPVWDFKCDDDFFIGGCWEVVGGFDDEDARFDDEDADFDDEDADFDFGCAFAFFIISSNKSSSTFVIGLAFGLALGLAL